MFNRRPVHGIPDTPARWAEACRNYLMFLRSPLPTQPNHAIQLKVPKEFELYMFATVPPRVRAETSLSETDLYGGFLSISFKILIVIAVMWPRYFYIKAGPVGVSVFVLATYVFLFVLVPLATLHHRVSMYLIELVRRSACVWVSFLLFSIWRALTSYAAPGLFGEAPMANFFRSYPPLAAYFVIGSVFLMDRRLREFYPRILVMLCIPIILLSMLEFATQTKLLLLFHLDTLAAGNANLEDGILKTTFRGDQFRVQSIFSQSLVFGQFAGSMLPLCLAVAKSNTRLWKQVGWTAFLLCILGVFFSTARSGVIVMAVALLSYFLLNFAANKRHRGLTLFVSFLLLIVGSTIVLQFIDASSVVAGRTSEEQVSSDARGKMFDRTVEQAARSPIMGYGDGTAKWLAGVIGKNNESATIDSFYLSVTLNNGYPGIVFLILLLTSILFLGVHNTFRTSMQTEQAMNAAFTAAVLSLCFGFSVLTIEDNFSFVFLAAAYMMAGRISKSTP